MQERGGARLRAGRRLVLVRRESWSRIEAIASVAVPTTVVGGWAAIRAAMSDELLRLGREALGSADWERARAVFEQAATLGESAEVLDGLGEALQFGGEHARAIELKERAFAKCGGA